MNQKINVIYEDNHLLVVEKPVNMPVQSDSSNDLDLLNILKNYLKVKYNKSGNVYLALVHRLDRPVGGIMVFAKTSKAASRLSNQVRKREFKKEYYAIIEGKIISKGILKDKLLKNRKTNMVKVDSKGKDSELEYEVIDYGNDKTLVHIWLKTGRSHQIRVQFASRNHPLYGDQRYNKNAKVGEQIALFAKTLSFYHPISKEYITFDLPLPSEGIWTLFKKIGNN